jgi:hypothetical protein
MLDGLPSELVAYVAAWLPHRDVVDGLSLVSRPLRQTLLANASMINHHWPVVSWPMPAAATLTADYFTAPVWHVRHLALTSQHILASELRLLHCMLPHLATLRILFPACACDGDGIPDTTLTELECHNVDDDLNCYFTKHPQLRVLKLHGDPDYTYCWPLTVPLAHLHTLVLTGTGPLGDDRWTTVYGTVRVVKLYGQSYEDLIAPQWPWLARCFPQVERLVVGRAEVVRPDAATRFEQLTEMTVHDCDIESDFWSRFDAPWLATLKAFVTGVEEQTDLVQHLSRGGYPLLQTLDVSCADDDHEHEHRIRRSRLARLVATHPHLTTVNWVTDALSATNVRQLLDAPALTNLEVYSNSPRLGDVAGLLDFLQSSAAPPRLAKVVLGGSEERMGFLRYRRGMGVSWRNGGTPYCGATP